MLKKLITISAILSALAGGFALYITHDGVLVTPTGKGTVVTESGVFEAFRFRLHQQRPQSRLQSYLVEAAPDKDTRAEVGTGYPVYMQHGNPTAGLLYRQVAGIPTERMRLIMPTMVGLGFSNKSCPSTS